jgi:hypothetical protein
MSIPKNIFFITIFLFATFRIHAQVTTQQDTFIVKAVTAQITVLPEKYYLYVNEDNFFKITYKGKNKLGHVEFRGGTAEKKDSLYNLRATTGTSAILAVYEKLKNGTERLAYTWTYKLYSREIPEVRLDGIPNDSVADKFTIIAVGQLRAKQKYGRDQYTITSFKLYIRNGNHFDTLSATGSRMTLEMKNRIDKMDVKGSGGILMFENIKAIDPNGKEVELPPLRIFLQDGKPVKVGL